MMNDTTGAYAQHARFWDWSGHDRTGEHEYWLQYAARYGRNVLIPMCAWGEAGAYMARRGFSVTAFDISPEMVAEGRKRFGDIPGLTLCEGDVTNFSFDIPPVDFCYSMDFEALPTLEDIKKALRRIHRHLRPGGCLAVIPNGPPKKTRGWGPETYLPLKQIYPGMNIWKTGHGRDDARTRRRHINQTLHIEHADGRTERFDHSLEMRCHTPRQWRKALKECGFKVVREHGGHGQAMSYGGGDTIEAIKI